MAKRTALYSETMLVLMKVPAWEPEKVLLGPWAGTPEL